MLTAQREKELRGNIANMPDGSTPGVIPELLGEIDRLRDEVIFLQIDDKSDLYKKIAEDYKKERDQLRASYGALSRDSLANCKHIEELHKERAHLRELLTASEMFREAYRKGKLELYSKGGEIAAAATSSLPCSEGPLERAVAKALGESTSVGSTSSTEATLYSGRTGTWARPDKDA